VLRHQRGYWQSLRQPGALLIILVMLFAWLTIFQFHAPRAYAHGDEDHGAQNQPQAPLPRGGEMNVKLVKTSSLELLLKYLTPQPHGETLIRIFLTDIKTNAPVSGADIKLNFIGAPTPSSAGQLSEVAVTATEKAGIYQARATFNNAGNYNISLKIKAANIDAQAMVNGIVVTDEIAVPRAGVIGNISLLTIIIISCFIIIAALSLLFLRARKAQPPDSERSQQTI
jgi:hypothetical protein